MAIGDPCDICGRPIPAGSRGPTKRCSLPCWQEARRRRERASYAADPQRFITTVKRYGERHPDRLHLRSLNRVKPDPEISRRSQLRTRYGLTVDQYDAMLEAQGGLCALCDSPPQVRRLSVDHDHLTGAVRGLLCGRCNLALAFFEDQDLFDAATDYLRRHSQQQEVS